MTNVSNIDAISLNIWVLALEFRRQAQFLTHIWKLLFRLYNQNIGQCFEVRHK